VPFRNAESTIGALLRALASLRHPPGGVEFIFVDNGSTDAGPDLVRAADLQQSRLVFEPERGVSAARNRGLANAHAEVVAIVDSDCIPSRTWLTELIAPFDEASTHLAAGSLASFAPTTGAQRFAARYGLNDAQRSLGMALPFANGRNMAVRRPTAEAVGGWSIELLRGDDIDFSTRVLRAYGGTIAYCERALVYHQDRATDQELWQQAHGYGWGIALMYDRYPEALPWRTPQAVRRVRSSARRRLSANFAQVGRRVGLVSEADAEFARYLAEWDRWFWRGFFELRRSGRGSSPSLVART
jgi:GT2 family glycosyltransferase